MLNVCVCVCVCVWLLIQNAFVEFPEIKKLKDYNVLGT